MLSNIELEDMAEKDGLDLIGVYSKNKIPTERRVGSYIINMQDFEDGNGTHWIAFKIFDNGKACYFDSFGTIYPEDVGEFLKIFKPIAWNNRQIQYPKSEMCGWFCLAFIKYFNDFDTKKTDVFEAYDDFLNIFSNDTKKNDKIVSELLKKY
jgi:hypothetical protein